MENTPILTLGIPTRHTGSKSIIRTIKSIRESAGDIPVDIIMVSDNLPLAQEILSELKDMGVRVIENKTPGSQFQKLSQIIKMVQTPYFVFTQDDVLFTPSAVRNILKGIEKKPNCTLLSVKVLSYPASHFIERVIQVGVDISYEIGRAWRRGNNYLLANGRCMVFKTKKIQEFRLPESVVNGDAYLYFINKLTGGTMCHIPSAVVLNNNPQRIKEHLNQAKRFQYSREEMEKIFAKDLGMEYGVPMSLELSKTFVSMVRNPIHTACYILVNLLSKVIRTDKSIVSRTVWESAESTKRP